MPPSDGDITKLAALYRVGDVDLVDVLRQVWELGHQVGEEFGEAKALAGAECVYRVVRTDGTPVSSRVWTAKGHASLSLLRFGAKVQEGKVVWEKEEGQ
jgi:hypothetical protein